MEKYFDVRYTVVVFLICLLIVDVIKIVQVFVTNFINTYIALKNITMYVELFNKMKNVIDVKEGVFKVFDNEDCQVTFSFYKIQSCPFSDAKGFRKAFVKAGYEIRDYALEYDIEVDEKFEDVFLYVKTKAFSFSEDVSYEALFS